MISNNAGKNPIAVLTLKRRTALALETTERAIEKRASNDSSPEEYLPTKTR